MTRRCRTWSTAVRISGNWVPWGDLRT